jgi:hypothetical protein
MRVNVARPAEHLGSPPLEGLGPLPVPWIDTSGEWWRPNDRICLLCT